MQEAAPPPGILGLPQAPRENLPGPRAAPGDGQLRRPQASDSEGLARTLCSGQDGVGNLCLRAPGANRRIPADISRSRGEFFYPPS
jgi:hypothetical protein